VDQSEESDGTESSSESDEDEGTGWALAGWDPRSEGVAAVSTSYWRETQERDSESGQRWAEEGGHATHPTDRWQILLLIAHQPKLPNCTSAGTSVDV
jgi:hypothetical protein